MDAKEAKEMWLEKLDEKAFPVYKDILGRIHTAAKEGERFIYVTLGDSEDVNNRIVDLLEYKGFAVSTHREDPLFHIQIDIAKGK